MSEETLTPIIEFQVGDTIVYPNLGGGRIEAMTEREVLGKKQDYLKVTFVKSNTDMLVPLTKGQEVGMRHTVELEKLPEVIALMLQADMKLSNQWPPRFRAEQDMIARGETFELAHLVGTLTVRDGEKGLADTERDIMENAKELLASEIAVIKDIELADAKAQLNDELHVLIGA